MTSFQALSTAVSSLEIAANLGFAANLAFLHILLTSPVSPVATGIR